VNRIQGQKYYICFSGQLTSGIIMYIIPAIHMNYQNCNIQKPRSQFN